MENLMNSHRFLYIGFGQTVANIYLNFCALLLKVYDNPQGYLIWDGGGARKWCKNSTAVSRAAGTRQQFSSNFQSRSPL